MASFLKLVEINLASKMALVSLICAVFIVPYSLVVDVITDGFTANDFETIFIPFYNWRHPASHHQHHSSNFSLLAVATRDSCAFKRFERSAYHHKMPLKVLGMGHTWRGFGQKLKLVKHEVEKEKDNVDKIIMVVDAYDVLINANVDDIISRFKEFNARILFSAEWNCWPDETLCKKTPEVPDGKRHLNAGLFIGYAPELYEALTSFPILSDADNDQKYFYQVYTDDEKRQKLQFKLDHRSQLFQTFEGGQNNVELVFDGSKSYLHNKIHDTYPLVIHTPGHCKKLFEYMSGFIPKVWPPGEQEDPVCQMETKDFFLMVEDSYPSLAVAILADKIGINLPAFFTKLERLRYPKTKIHLFIRYNDQRPYAKFVEDFARNCSQNYGSLQLEPHNETNKKLSLTEMGLEYLVEKKVSHYVNFNAVSLLHHPYALHYLIESNRKITAATFGSDKNFTSYIFFFKQHDHCRNYIEISSNKDRLVIGLF